MNALRGGDMVTIPRERLEQLQQAELLLHRKVAARVYSERAVAVWKDCICSTYGHGLSLTAVKRKGCPVHDPGPDHHHHHDYEGPHHAESDGCTVCASAQAAIERGSWPGPYRSVYDFGAPCGCADAKRTMFAPESKVSK